MRDAEAGQEAILEYLDRHWHQDSEGMEFEVYCDIYMAEAEQELIDAAEDERMRQYVYR